MKTHVIELVDPRGGGSNTDWSLKVDGEVLEGKVVDFNYSSRGVRGPGVFNVCRYVEPYEETQGQLKRYWTAFLVRHCNVYINENIQPSPGSIEATTEHPLESISKNQDRLANELHEFSAGNI